MGENHPWRWTAYLSSFTPNPWKIHGMAPPGGQCSAKFPLRDSKAANPAGCRHSPDTQSPCSGSSSSKSLSWEALGRAAVTAEPHGDGENPDCPSRASPGAPQHLQLVHTAPEPPQLHTNPTSSSCSPARIPQNHPGLLLGKD